MAPSPSSPSPTTPLREPARRRARLLPALAAAVATASLAVISLTGDPAASAQPAPAAAAHTGTWQRTQVPLEKGDLTAVSALSDTQAWAVGYQLKSATSLDAVALRWDGTAWTQESTLPKNSFPQALAVRSAEDIWVVGSATEHWDGKSWTTRALDRDPAGRVVPDAVATAPGGQAWAVGRAMARSVKDGVPAIQLWDGKAWKRQTLPDVGAGELNGVAVVAPDDVWAVGAVYGDDEKPPQTSLLLHWNGTAWKRIAAPDPADAAHWLSGITPLGADDIWAVGGSAVGSSERPYAVHWDGTKWAATTTPDVADGRLRSVGRSADGTIRAVGGKGSAPVTLRWNAPDKRWDMAPGPGVVVRGFATVPNSSRLWVAGIATHGDLVPAVTRYTDAR
ncbi:hypothetical protein [Streptomyces sp. NPDC048248]|uniref:hypothetical protein n=1 Tax=Streptomyces sp. NPDC048248 TaxID=3365523 RepID=UPI00371B1396